MSIESNQEDCIIQVNDDLQLNESNESNIIDNNSQDLNYFLKKYNINKNEYIVPIFTNYYYSRDYVVGNNNLYDLICPICYNILNNPKKCSLNNNSHSFCKECIDKYLEEDDKCPICKNYFEYRNNYKIQESLNKLYFKCIYFKEGCNEVVNYGEYFDHINNCKYQDLTYECRVEKYNYLEKRFEKCNFQGNIKEIDKHFKNCAFLNYKCIICKKNIKKIFFREHIESEFEMTMINFANGDRYEGEFYNNLPNGYGIYYDSNGDKYEGEFIDDRYDGYGIIYCSNGDRYEGEFRNGLAEGYGVFYFSNKGKYEGEFHNGVKDGYGIFYYSNGGKYEGEFYNDLKDGYGIECYNGIIYIGEFYNDLKDGYGIIYYSNGDKYKGEFKNNLKNGYGIYYFIEGDVYEGEFKNDMMENYGIIKYSNGDIYEGEFKNGIAEGYGVINYLNGEKYQGEWKNGKAEGFGREFHSDGTKFEGEFRNNSPIKINYFTIFKFYICMLLKIDNKKSFLVKILCFIFILFFLIYK